MLFIFSFGRTLRRATYRHQQAHQAHGLKVLVERGGKEERER